MTRNTTRGKEGRFNGLVPPHPIFRFSTVWLTQLTVALASSMLLAHTPGVGR